MSRKDHLEQSIRESHAIIREYEGILQTSNRAEERLRAQRQIDRQWRLIEGCLKEYAPLAGGVLPPDIAEIAAHFNPTGQDSTTGVQVVQQPRTINTEGGAYVEGTVGTGGGEFIGRDQHIHGDKVQGDKVMGDKVTIIIQPTRQEPTTGVQAVREYVDLEIHILGQQANGYPVDITLNGQQEFRGYLSAGILPWVSTGDRAADGRELFDALFDDRKLRDAWGQAKGMAIPRHIRLCIDVDAPALHALPWELMQEGEVMLSAGADTPFSRYLPDDSPWGGAVQERPMRVLAVISNPQDLQERYHLLPVDVEAERGILESALATVDQVKLDFLDAPVTPERLEGALRKRYHVLHFVGHGAFSTERQQAALYMQDGNGNAQRVLDGDLVRMLAQLGTRPELVTLVACQSATRSTADAFAGLGPKLVSIGIPAVLAMQDVVTIETARVFEATFYQRLLAHGYVDLAANEARGTLLTAGRSDAAVPVLFLRLKDGQLFAPVRGERVSPIPGVIVRETILDQGKSLRDVELAYLDGLLEDYKYWLDHYTPLAGIAEVRAAVKDGPRLDLPMPFIPRGFEKLIEHDFGGRGEVKREQVDDLREAINEHRRIILLGDPGSGKTTTLWRLAYDYAQAAREDEKAPLPVFVPLGSYTDDGPFDDYLARHLGQLSSDRLILLLDGLNEMPQVDYSKRVGRIREVLAQYPGGMVVVTCRALDYVVRLENLQKVEVSPLDDDRIRDFLHNYLGEGAGERLYQELWGGDGVQELWDTWQGVGGTWEQFWTADTMPRNVYSETTPDQDRLWADLKQGSRPLLTLGRNPYLLLMMAQVYAEAGGVLPSNRARLFEAFADTLLEREKERGEGEWIEAQTQKDGLAALAYAMQIEGGGQGTTVGRKWALEHLCKAVPGCDAERLLYLATSASLLDTSDTTVRFYHQLLQEYFAACGLKRQTRAFTQYWSAGWWVPSGWEETFILLSGVEEDASALLVRLAEVNPVVAARCLTQGGATADGAARGSTVTALVPALSDERASATARCQAGYLLGRLGDPRPGVSLRADGLPDIAWCDVPAGSFLMGSDDAPYDDEKPQHKVYLPAFQIAKHLVTNAQYAAFVRDGGYTDKWRACWTDAGWEWKEDRSEPGTYSGVYDLPNHPVVGVTWYEAVAFCHWLTEQLRRADKIGTGTKVALPSEAQWEKAARGTDGRIYPWGDDPDPNRANYDDTGIGTTSAVGCFPGGASPYGVLDMSGNVWEWCRTEWQDSYENYQNADDLEGTGRRVVRGGSRYLRGCARCSARLRFDPVSRSSYRGFRLVVSPIS